MNLSTLMLFVFSFSWMPYGVDGKQVAFTFDDLPATHGDFNTMKRVTDSILIHLQRNQVPAAGFINEGKLFTIGETDERIDLLRQWLNGGHVLGNHTFSHIAIDRNPVEAYMEDVIRGETITRILLSERGLKLRYFRHTQLRTGPTKDYKLKLDQFLKDRGYIVAAVTMDNQEWLYAAAYSKAQDDAVRKNIGDEYVQYMETTVDFFEKLSRETLGYEVKQILLLHANEINADYLQSLINMFRKRNYQFITLEEALSDPAYSMPTPVSTRGLSWIHRWRLAKGMKMMEEPRESDQIRKLAGQ